MTPGKTFTDLTMYLINDRNYNDIAINRINQYQNLSGALNEGKWTDEGNYDISWYNETDTEFVLYTAEELAGLSSLLKNDICDFKGKTIKRKLTVERCVHCVTSTDFRDTGRFRGVPSEPRARRGDPRDRSCRTSGRAF